MAIPLWVVWLTVSPQPSDLQPPPEADVTSSHAPPPDTSGQTGRRRRIDATADANADAVGDLDTVTVTNVGTSLDADLAPTSTPSPTEDGSSGQD